jgi:hypothetical protein
MSLLHARSVIYKAKPYHLHCRWRHVSDMCSSYQQNDELFSPLSSLFGQSAGLRGPKMPPDMTVFWGAVYKMSPAAQ